MFVSSLFPPLLFASHSFFPRCFSSLFVAFFFSPHFQTFFHFSLSPRYISAHNTFFDKLFPSFFQLACCMILFFLSLPLDNFEISSSCLRFSLSFNEYAFSSTTSSSLLSPTRPPPRYSILFVLSSPPKNVTLTSKRTKYFLGGRSRERYEARWRSAVSSRIHIQ